MEPLVSVVIPTYFSEKYIEKCIDSILNQTYQNFEIVICDDASEDGTREILKKYESDPRITVLYNEKNLHQGATRNRCFEKCSGEYIMLQDADDVSEPNRMERLLKAFEEYPEEDFIGSYGYLFDADGKYADYGWGPEKVERKHLLGKNPFIPASMMLKTKAVKAVNGYHIAPYTERGEDYDFIFRLYGAGFHGRQIKDRLYGYLVDRNTYSRRTLKSRVDESYIRYLGFKENHILFPIGWLLIYRPVAAYFAMQLRLLFLGTRYDGNKTDKSK